jgi:hypothetical protein
MNRISNWLRTAAAETRVTVLILLLGGAVALFVLGQPDEPVPGSARGAGLIGIQFTGTQTSAGWSIAAYGRDNLWNGYWWHAGFLVCLSLGLALLARWGGRNYRTVSTRRLSRPLAWAAIGALALAVLGHVLLWLGLDQRVDGVWRFVAVTTWGTWLIFVLVAAYGVGGLLSRLLRGAVLDVLREADDDRGDAPTAKHTTTEELSRFGLAFSGGGVRAASISLGALQGLERYGRMGWDSADHITSVSGGSYMAGAWSLARGTARGPSPLPDPPPDSPPELPVNDARPRPWEAVADSYGAEERHLRANLGYLLSNTPRGTGDDTIARTVNPAESARRQRLPAAVATVLTGMLVNAAVFLIMLWLLSQLLGIFYRWYFGLGGGLRCLAWPLDGVALRLDRDGSCMEASDRLLWPIMVWLVVGLASVLVWVVAAKAAEVIGDPSPPAWLLALKYLGYGGVGLAAGLGVLLGLLPFLLRVLWDPVEANALVTNVIAVAGAIGSAGAVFRLLRRPLAKVAPVLGGVLFALVLAYVVCFWALRAMIAAPASRDASYWVVFGLLVAVLAFVHFFGAIEFWSLAAFYRGKLRSAFATYRIAREAPPTQPWNDVRAKAFVNNSQPPPDEYIEPVLSRLRTRHVGPDGKPAGTPLTICAAATISGRQVRTHYGIPALSVTFSPEHVRMHAPLDQDGRWQRYQCSTSAMDALQPALTARLTTMMAVGMSGAAVSPAMGRFNVGPISMLLAFFNVRLGTWIPNPRYAATLATQGKRLPRPGLGYLLKEFLGFHDPSDLYVYVTDGGHWENTALVELLRTCHHREIVCVDADAGPGNLAKSISKAIDLAQLECAANIAINLDVLRADRDPSPGRDYSQRSVNVGLVRRRDAEQERISILWYCKPALTQDMPPQLLAYREVDPTFPRVSTINQFFHVAQFAAYRDLGRYNARKILIARETLTEVVGKCADFEAFDRWLRVNPPADEDWVLPEMLGLIEQLTLDRDPAERVAYRRTLYRTIREALTEEVAAEAPARVAWV